MCDPFGGPSYRRPVARSGAGGQREHYHNPRARSLTALPGTRAKARRGSFRHSARSITGDAGVAAVFEGPLRGRYTAPDGNRGNMLEAG
jgi:hypothetical protein